MNRPSGTRNWTLLLLLALMMLVLALHEVGQLGPLEDVLSLVLGPVQRTLSGLVRSVGDLFQSAREVRDLQAEVDELRASVENLTAENVRLREFEAENAQLRALLNFADVNPSLRFAGGDVIGRGSDDTASVIGYDPSPFFSYLIINRGENDGIEVGMPVVTLGAVLVGRVAEVYPRSAKVQLLIDPSSRVNGVIQSSRAKGLVAGQPDGTLRMEQIPQSERLNEGDLVLTSGLGGNLPKALVIGQVTQIQARDIDLTKQALLRPAVDYSRLEIVLVITDFDPIQEVQVPEESP